MALAVSDTWRLLPACLLGVVASLLVYMLFLTQAWVYFSNDPYACTNCHVMEESVSSWLASSHHATALCYDCHAPRSAGARQISRATNGIRHGWVFTFGAGEVAHLLREESSRIVEKNCIRCHEGLFGGPGAERASGGTCTRCHRAVGHG